MNMDNNQERETKLSKQLKNIIENSINLAPFLTSEENLKRKSKCKLKNDARNIRRRNRKSNQINENKQSS